MRFFNLNAAIAITSAMVLSCAPSEQAREGNYESDDAINAAAPSTASRAPASVAMPTKAAPTSGSSFKPYPPLWEAANSNGVMWSSYAYQVIGDEASVLLGGTSDMGEFCPHYSSLNTQQRENFWAYLVSIVAKYESAFNPTSRYRETAMGRDPVTHSQVMSEGLLQLSYQDAQGHPFCKFNWAHDRTLPVSTQRTILNPLTNLECGIDILAQQIREQHKIAVTHGVYWSTLVPGGPHGKIPQIRALTHKIPFC